MCGICGIVGVNREEATAQVSAMCRALAHRGPDDELVVSGANWALGQRRLSIIDLSQNARQPFVNEDGSRFLTSNGEIYNFRDLRPSLITAGHRFVSGSDCEVILHLLEEEGERGVLKLNGMFAFAYLDERRRKLILCRDRLGIKPLYFSRTPGSIFFASEIKALVGAVASLNRDHLVEFFQYRYLSGSDTLFRDVQEILPGHLVSIDLDTLAMEDREYWAPSLRLTSGAHVDETALSREIENAVSRQLVSDVPVGCQLSGGLDSSLVTQMAMSQMNNPMHTFSVGFDGHAEDESSWAALISQQLGTLHHAIQYQESDFLSDLAACTWLNDEPLNHPNSVAMFKMCQEAKSHVTVLMTGEGADELFGGYTWHKRLWRLRRFGRLAQWPLIRELVSALPGNRFAPLLPLLGCTPREMAVRAGQWIPDKGIRELLEPRRNNGGTASVSSDLNAGYGSQLAINTVDSVAASLDLDLRTYLVSVLQRQDRMSMASGVESRVPFLDHELVDFVLKIPMDQLFEGGRGKVILRNVAAGRIPDAIINRPKVGFRIPLAEWMRQGQGLSSLLDWLCDERSAERRIWKIDPVRQLVAEHRSGKADNSNVLWGFLSFEVWARIWLDGTPHEKLKEEISEKSGVRSQNSEVRKPSTTQQLNNSTTPPKAPLRICHIVTSLRMGGMERMVCDLMGGLQERGIESVLCCTDEMGELYDGAQAEAKFCGHRTPGLFVIDWKLAFQIHRFMRDNHVDVIHAHNHAPHLYGALLSFFTGIPLIATRHGQGYNDKWRVRFLKRILAGKTGTVVLVSEDAKRVSLANHSLSEDDAMIVIPNGVNTALFVPEKSGGRSQKSDDLRARLGIPVDAIVIGSVGRLSPEKNYSLLVRAFASLSRKVDSCQAAPLLSHDQKDSSSLPTKRFTNLTTFLMLVGDGLDRPVIEAEIARHNIQDHCRMVGMQGQILPWLYMMDIFCLSSDTEGLSISLLEAGACGLPSVVTDAGGNPEIIKEGVTGVVVPVRDEEALAVGLEHLISDEALRCTMGVAARKTVEEHFSLNAMVDRYVNVFEEAVHLKWEESSYK